VVLYLTNSFTNLFADTFVALPLDLLYPIFLKKGLFYPIEMESKTKKYKKVCFSH